MYSVIPAFRGSGTGRKQTSFFLCSSVSIHFCLEDTRWHNQIKLESFFSPPIPPSTIKPWVLRAMYHTNRQQVPDSQTAAQNLLSLNSLLSLNVGFSHGGYSLQATNKREWRTERGNTYQHDVDSMLRMNNPPSFARTWLNDQDVCVPSPRGAPTIILLSVLFASWRGKLDLLLLVMLLTLPLLPQLFADSVTDSFSSLFHYPCPPPHSSPQYLMAESEVTDQSLHPPGLHMTAWHFALWSAKILHLFWVLLELLSVWAECILAEGVLLKCVANGLHRGINMEMNVVPSRIFVVSEETLRLVWILIFIRFSKHSEEDVWTVAVLLFS